MKKLITLSFIFTILCTSCSDFKEKGKPLFKDLTLLYEISIAKCKTTNKVWTKALEENRYALHTTDNFDDYYAVNFEKALQRMEKERAVIEMNNQIDSLRLRVEGNVGNISDKKHDSYDKFLLLYSNIIELSKRAKKPTGSLESFTSDINQKEGEIDMLITEIKARNPEFDK